MQIRLTDSAHGRAACRRIHHLPCRKACLLYTSEKLEKLNRQKTAAEKKLIAAQHREKQLEHERKRLTRSERTHRLCTRAGMLEKFLREPTLLTDDDVMELLTFLFHGEAAQKKLDTLIDERRKTLTTDGSENPLF